MSRSVEAVAAYNASHSAGLPVILVFDGAKTRFNRGADVLNILADSIMFPAPRLLAVIDTKGIKKDHIYLAAELTKCLAASNIRKEDVVGVVSDTTSVMPKAIRHAGLIYIPRVSHVGKAIMKGMEVQPLSAWHAFLAYSRSRIGDLEAS